MINNIIEIEILTIPEFIYRTQEHISTYNCNALIHKQMELRNKYNIVFVTKKNYNQWSTIFNGSPSTKRISFSRQQ